MPVGDSDDDLESKLDSMGEKLSSVALIGSQIVYMDSSKWPKIIQLGQYTTTDNGIIRVVDSNKVVGSIRGKISSQRLISWPKRNSLDRMLHIIELEKTASVDLLINEHEYSIHESNRTPQINEKDIDVDFKIGQSLIDQFSQMIKSHSESSIYQSFFDQLIVKDTLIDHYHILNKISISQIGLSKKLISDISNRNDLLRRTNVAIRLFKTLPAKTTVDSKIELLIKTIELITINEKQLDADSILSILIYVICHAQIPNLPSHLTYITTFAPIISKYKNLSLGFEGYILSTFEVAIKSFQSQLPVLLSHCQNNLDLWSLLNVNKDKYLSNRDKKLQNHKNDVESIEKLKKHLHKLHALPATLMGDDCDTNPLFACTVLGETYLSLALDKMNTPLLECILSLVAIDDLINETNIFNQSFLVKSLSICHPFADVILEIMWLNCTSTELENILHKVDHKGKTFGHYLAHLPINIWNDSHSLLLEPILELIDWDWKDNNGLTPLMNILKCYDLDKYETILTKVIENIKKTTANIDRKNNYSFTLKHVDNQGNSLLHVIRHGSIMRLLLQLPNQNLNHFNNQGLTPLSIAIKFSRLETLKILILDKRVDMYKYSNSQTGFLGINDYIKDSDSLKDSEIEKIVENVWLNPRVGEQWVINKARFEIGRGFCVNLTMTQEQYENFQHTKYDKQLPLLPNNNVKTLKQQHRSAHFSIGFNNFIKLLKLLKVQRPMIPFNFKSIYLPEILDINMKGNLGNCNKLKINYLILNLNVLWGMLKEIGILEKCDIWQKVFFSTTSTKTQTTITEWDDLKMIKLAKPVNVNFDAVKLKRISMTSDTIYSYLTFIDYSIDELKNYEAVYEDMFIKLNKLFYDYQSFTHNDVKLIQRFTRNEHNYDYYDDIMNNMMENEPLIKLRLLTALTKDLINSCNELKMKISLWLKYNKLFDSLKNELNKLSSIITQFHSEEFDDALSLIQWGLSQIETLLGIPKTFESYEQLANDLTNLKNGKSSNNFKLVDINIGSNYTQRNKLTLLNKLIVKINQIKLDFLNICFNINEGYEILAEFLSEFYSFKNKCMIDIFKLMAKNQIKKSKEIIIRRNSK